MIIQGCGIFTVTGNSVLAVEGGGQYKIRMKLVNISGPEETSILIGYVIRNNRGVDIASNSSLAENTDLGTIKQGELAVVDIFVDFPMFHPGSYSLTPRIAYFQNGDIELADSPENSILFEITSQKTVYVLMTLPTKYSRVE
jgi:hypothetical protein